MGFFDIGKKLFKGIGAGIHKVTNFGQDLFDGIGKGLTKARAIADLASNIPVVGTPLRGAANALFDTVEGARAGLGEILNVGNAVGDVLEGVKLPSGPAVSGNVTNVPQALVSAPRLGRGGGLRIRPEVEPLNQGLL